MIKTVVVDDEPKSVEILSNLLSNFKQIRIIDTACSVNEAIYLLERNDPDLVFLDIVMPEQTGFDFLNQIDNKYFEVIFCTGYDHYAIKAIKFAALDYLVKPVDMDELAEALKRVETKLGQNQKDNRIKNLIYNQTNRDMRSHKLAIPTSYGFDYITVKNIIRCEADGNYTTFHLQSGEKVMVSKNIKEFEDVLTPHYFFRVHKSHLINIEHISKYLKKDGGYVIMKDGSKIELSRRKKPELLDRLKIQ